MSVEREIAELADAAHHASSRRAFRTEALRRIERVLGADYGLFWSVDGNSADVAIQGFDEAFWSTFATGISLYEPDTAQIRAWAAEAGGVAVDTMVASPQQLDALPIYRNIIRPIGSRVLMSALVGPPGNPLAVLNFGRNGSSFDTDDVALVHRFLAVLSIGDLAHAAPVRLIEAATNPQPGREAEARARTRALSKRERELLELFAAGASYAEAASALAMSINTVRQHVRNLYEKLGVSSKTEAVLRGLGTQGQDQQA